MEIGLQSGAETQGTNGNNEEGKEGLWKLKLLPTILDNRIMR